MQTTQQFVKAWLDALDQWDGWDSAGGFASEVEVLWKKAAETSVALANAQAKGGAAQLAQMSGVRQDFERSFSQLAKLLHDTNESLKPLTAGLDAEARAVYQKLVALEGQVATAAAELKLNQASVESTAKWLKVLGTSLGWTVGIAEVGYALYTDTADQAAKVLTGVLAGIVGASGGSAFLGGVGLPLPAQAAH